MHYVPSRRKWSIAPAAAVACLVLAMMPAGPARAADPLGFYVGGAVGQAQVEFGVPSASYFRENHSAYKLMIGVRPISLVGAEVAYLDFGHPSGNAGIWPADVSMKGTAAFGILYLPVPVVDVYAKAGVARLQSTLNISTTYLCAIGVPNCNLGRLDRTDTGFAAGVGAQLKFGPVAVRAEYERFNVAGAYPGLASVGVTWAFL